MKDIAIVYATNYGQTRKIAEHMQKALVSKGARVELHEIGRRDSMEFFVDKFDAVILGGGIIVSKFPKGLLVWAKNQAQTLSRIPVGLFSVSMNAADPRPGARAADRLILDTFMKSTGVKPTVDRSLIGSVLYTKYNFFIRWIMKRISAAANGPTDTSKDHELTDWDEVDRFALDVLALCSEGRALIA